MCTHVLQALVPATLGPGQLLPGRPSRWCRLLACSRLKTLQDTKALAANSSKQSQAICGHMRPHQHQLSEVGTRLSSGHLTQHVLCLAPVVGSSCVNSSLPMFRIAPLKKFNRLRAMCVPFACGPSGFSIRTSECDLKRLQRLTVSRVSRSSHMATRLSPR